MFLFSQITKTRKYTNLLDHADDNTPYVCGANATNVIINKKNYSQLSFISKTVDR